MFPERKIREIKSHMKLCWFTVPLLRSSVLPVWGLIQCMPVAFHSAFLSPPVLMHGGLLGIAFCPSVCPSIRPSVRPGQILEKSSLEKNSYPRKVKSVKVKGHKRSRSKVRSKVKVTMNVKEKAGGLMPTSSCFILSSSLATSIRMKVQAHPNVWFIAEQLCKHSEKTMFWLIPEKLEFCRKRHVR